MAKQSIQLYSLPIENLNTSWVHAIALSKIVTVEQARKMYTEIRSAYCNLYAESNAEFDSMVLDGMMSEQFQTDLQYKRIPSYMHWLRYAVDLYRTTPKDYRKLTIDLDQDFIDEHTDRFV